MQESPRPDDLPVKEARGAAMPVPGFGTWQLEDGQAREMILTALEMGYRHIDTAENYGNEAAIGRGLEESGVDRARIFLTSKVESRHFESGDFNHAVEKSLERLRTDHLDLLLLHWPFFRGTTLEAAVERLNAAKDAGLTLHIGVSNFTTDLLDQAWAASTYPLMTNQVEYHPFLDQDELLEAVEAHRMIFSSYCPVAHGRTAENPVLKRIGGDHGKTGAQVALRWLVQRGTVPLPRTSNPEHARENLDIFDFELDEEEMEQIHGLHEPDGRIIEPSEGTMDWD